MISEALQAVSEGLFRRLFRFVFRYDIFISYARGDGSKYAAALKDQLNKLDFTCFLDVEELPPGNALTRTLRRALKGSATLVIVVTERATASHYCALEAESFAATERAIVPIDFGGTVAKATWPWLKERELVWIDELPDALTRNVPSPIVADSIDRLFKYTRRNVRVRGQWIGVLVLFLIGAAVATFVIRQQVNEARAAGLEAQRQKVEAVKQTEIATKATSTALIAQEQANKAAEEAKKQEAIALQNAERARQEQRKAEAQTRLALSNSMAIDARTRVERRPISALLLAAEATQIVLRAGGVRASAAEDALRQALVRVGGIPLTGHTGTAWSIAASPDGRWLFTSASDGIGCLWSMREPKLDAPLRLLKAHAGLITAVSFSPDNRWLATGGEDNVVRIWDLEAAQQEAAAKELRFADRGAPGAISWSPDSRLIAVAGEREKVAQLWDLSKPDPQSSPFTFTGHTYAIENVVFSANGRWLVTTTRDPYALLWDMASGTPAGEPLKLPSASSVNTEGFSNDGHWLAIGDAKGKLQLFDLTAPQIAASVRELAGMKDVVFRMAFSPDSRWLAVGGNGRTAHLWDLSKPNPEQSAIQLRHEGPDGPTDAILHLAFDSISRSLLTAGHFDHGEGAHLWPLSEPLPASRVSLRGIGSYATAAAFVSYDRVAVATLDGLSVWNSSGGPAQGLPTKLVGHDGRVTSIFAGGDGEWLVTAASDATPRFWDLRDSRRDTFPQRLSDETRHHGRVVLSADGHWLVSETQEHESVFIFTSERADGRFARAMQVSGPFLAMSPDSRWLATSVSREISNETRIDALSLLDLRLGDKRMKDPELIGTIEQPVDAERRGPSEQRVTAAAFSPNGKTIAAGHGDGIVRLWNLPVAAAAKGRELRGHKGAIEAIAFSRDGHWLVTGGADMKAILWDMTAPNPAAAPKVLAGHNGSVHIILFSSDGRWLFTGSRTQYDSEDGKLSAFLWDLRQPGVAGTVLPGHEGYISAADISADGRWLATGSRVGSYLRLWDLTRANPAARPIRAEGSNGPILNLGFSSDGRMLLTRSENSALLWDMRHAGNAMKPFLMGLGTGDIRWAGFSPDSTLLITGGWQEGTSYSWDATAPDPTVGPVALRGDAGGFFAGAVSADSRVLVGTSNEGTKSWLLRPAEIVAAACRIAGRNLTVAEWRLLVPGQAYRKTCPDYPTPEY